MRTESGGALRLAEQVSALRRALLRSLAQRLSGSPRPIPQLLAMRLVFPRRGALAGVELTDRLGIDAPAASRLVDKLESDGLLSRTPSPNRRCVLLKVTPMATRCIQQLEIGLEALGDQMRASLNDDEIEQTTTLLEKLIAGLTQAEHSL